MYSVRRSLKAACAWRFLCLRSSEVAYIYDDCQTRHEQVGKEDRTGLRPPLRF